MKRLLEINDWQVLPATGQVKRGDIEHRLEPKAMAVLVYLTEHAGEIVTRNELEQQVWQGSVVTYEALTVTINKIRAVLEDDSRQPRYIETIPKRGYRLIATVKTEQSDPPLLHASKKSKNQKNYAAAIIFMVAVLSLILLFNLFTTVRNDDTQLSLPRQDLPSIAVIPFANNNNNPEQDYFAAGITEYLITDLSRQSSLLVTSRNSVLGFNSHSANIKNISQTLNVQYILTGSVLKNANQMRKRFA